MALALVGAAGAGPDAPPRTPNEFLARGAPTFVLGTAGDDRADAAIAAQAGMVRDVLFARSPVVKDVALDPSKGLEGWPENPVVYGGPHVNSLVAAVAPGLPFRIGVGRLEIGGKTFEGDEYRLIAVVPERARTAEAPARPAFLLYAGTGTPGIAEINGVRHGPEGVLVIDRFGPLLRGTWQDDARGGVSVRFSDPAPRPAWRLTKRALPSGKDGVPPGEIEVARLALVPIGDAAREAAEDETIVRGTMRAVAALGVAPPKGIVFHLYPDRRSKASVTSQGGDGHADAVSRTLHVFARDPAAGGTISIEPLIAHEATHVIAHDAFAAPGTSCMGEGLAVWVAGTYQGTSLDAWKERLPEQVPSVLELLGPAFRRMPEPVAYPLAGLLVETLVKRVGFAAVVAALLPATAASWADACKAAGTTSAEVEATFRAALGRK